MWPTWEWALSAPLLPLAHIRGPLAGARCEHEGAGMRGKRPCSHWQRGVQQWITRTHVSLRGALASEYSERSVEVRRNLQAAAAGGRNRTRSDFGAGGRARGGALGGLGREAQGTRSRYVYVVVGGADGWYSRSLGCGLL
eukprot:scaffold27640_cov133-Isochrysis_galbana.AAC.1